MCKYIQNMPSIFLRNHDHGAHITYKLLRTYSFTTSYVQIACAHAHVTTVYEINLGTHKRYVILNVQDQCKRRGGDVIFLLMNCFS